MLLLCLVSVCLLVTVGVVYCLCFGLGFAVFAFRGCGLCCCCDWWIVFVDCFSWLGVLFCYVVVCFLFWFGDGWLCGVLIVVIVYLCCVMII